MATTSDLNDGFIECWNDDKYVGPEIPMTLEECVKNLRWFGLITTTEQLQEICDFTAAVKMPKVRFPRDPHKHQEAVK